METYNIVIIFLSLFLFGAGLFFFWKARRFKVDLKKKEEEIKQKMYEVAILKELGDRIGYSLNVEKIVDVITSSLEQFIDYSVVSYMLLEPEKIIFKAHLEQSVSRKFINDVRDRMLNSLSALLDKKFKKNQIAETISGAILVEEVDDPVRSFFNIPLVIGEKVAGILTVAHTKAGLYQEEEMTILYKITKQASNAVTRLEQVVKTEEEKLNAMVSSMTEGVVMTDKEYKIVVVNPAAKRAVGIEDKEEVSIFDFIDNLGGKFDIRGRLEESVRLEKIVEADDILINDRFFKIIVLPVRGDTAAKQNEILGAMAIFRDITGQKEIEKMRDDFTSMMVHELRSPLDGIKKMTWMMKQGEIEEAAEKKYVKMIYDTSAEMLELVNDLLDMVKIEAGKFEVNLEPADIKEAITDRIKFYRYTADDKKVKLDSYFSPDLPEKFKFDKIRLAQVLNNLISNAVKFTESGGKIEVRAFLHNQGSDVSREAKKAGVEWAETKEQESKDLPNSVIVAVVDTGIGIADEEIKQLFSKFKQLKASAANGQRGTGLGLVIVKGIIEAHRGKAGVFSTAGKGSTFYFTIPLK